MSNLKLLVENTIKEKMNNVCEGALIKVVDYYGTYFWHYKQVSDAIVQIESLLVDETLECEMELTFYLVPEGEGYKNYYNQYADEYDWMETLETYEWQFVNKITVG